MAPSIDITTNGTTAVPILNGAVKPKTTTTNHAVPDQNPIPASAGPDFSRLLHIEHGENYTTRAISKVTLPPHALFARITTATAVPSPAYTTVQCGPDAHVELNSDLVYINHSCAPNLVFDMEAWEVRASERGVRAGEELTFFYPSTEWQMDRPFDCYCGDPACLGKIDGAKTMQDKVLARYWLSPHIKALREAQAEGKKGDEYLTLGGKTGLTFRAVAGAGVV